MVYRSADGMLAALGDLMAGARRIAMNYSPAMRDPVCRARRCRHGGNRPLDRGRGSVAADLIQRFEAA